MKFTQFALAAALLATASAQGLDALPDCAKSCATSSIPANCGLNVQCICSDKSFLSNIACCVADKCSAADQATTIQVAKGICAGGGVTDLPATVVCSSTAAGSSSGTATGSSTETKTGSTASGSTTATATDTTLTGSASPTKTSASTTGSSASGAASAASSASHTASSAAATTGAAVLGQTRDSSLLAAAAGAAAFAIFV